MKALGETFRDAVEVTRRLGFGYIWIDALCIIQNSLEDWNNAAATMGAIYSNAYLTIAATSARDGNQGFLKPRPMSVEIPVDVCGSGFESLQVRQMLSHVAFNNYNVVDLVEAPLLSRAWGYQERLVSSRVLHFMSEEVVFECQEGLKCECGMIMEHLSPLTFPSIVKHDFSRALNAGVEVVSEAWDTIVREYTMRGLTFESDRLPALSAIARKFHSKMGPYVAGMWLQTLPRCLAWQPNRVDRIATRRNKGVPTRSRPHWDGARVVFPSLSVEGRLEILGCETSLVGVDTFGRTTAGVLYLKGILTVATLQYVRENSHASNGFDARWELTK